jgi:hypothetical protein
MKFFPNPIVGPLLSAALCVTAVGAEVPPEQAMTRLRPQLSNNLARPLRYHAVDGDFVITNGGEYFNRPLYGGNTSFRIDGGDKPEFSLYLPGRGGNLRLGLKTGAGAKWLNDASQIVSRYRAGALIYAIHDPLLGNGTLVVTALPLSGAKGLVIKAECVGASQPVSLIFAFGGANGVKGRRGGDIGCEREPVSQLFQLRPEQCRNNEIGLTPGGFTLRSPKANIAGIFPARVKIGVGDAAKWDSPEDLLASASPPAANPASLPVATGELELLPGENYFAVQQLTAAAQNASAVYKEAGGGDSDAVATEQSPPAVAPADLPEVFAAAEQHRRDVAGRVSVKTPDALVNSAAAALNVAADGVWDSRQSAFMHGAVAWRTRLLGWRGPYAGDALGWHERTAAHFAGFAREQNTSPIPAKIPPADEQFNLARSEAALHSNGNLTKSHYDMNLVAVDAFFRHLKWTGDLDYARQWWPVIERHFAWERRLFRREFGPDKLPLYENYAATWASDNLGYNGGGTAHASAYNYFANQTAARVAALIGKNPQPYAHEADLIHRAMEKYLWLADSGSFAEYKDYLGLQLAHPNAGLWTFYHTLDSEVPTRDEAWQMSRWVDENIAHIPIKISGAENQPTNLFILPETSWQPYMWSLNNVVVAENIHTALGYWQANRPETAFALFKGTLMETMCLGLCPGNVGAMTSHDAARGEAQRDFADAIGITSRAVVEGLFGVKPDLLAGELSVAPGFPKAWNSASIAHPDFNFEFRREGMAETYSVASRFSKPLVLRLEIGCWRTEVARVTVNGKPAAWKRVEAGHGAPRIEIRGEAASDWNIVVNWQGEAPVEEIPAATVPAAPKPAVAFGWNQPLPPKTRLEPVTLTPYFNDSVTQIFRHEYRSPRSPFCSLATPKQGLGAWADCNEQFAVDDSGLRAAAGNHDGQFVLPNGVAFATPTNQAATNILFTSQWDNFPDTATVPLAGKARRVFLLLAGSTGPMQSQFDNGEIIVTYADGTRAELALRNPDNWWPIEQDYFRDDFAFRLAGPPPPRVDLKTGVVRFPDAKSAGNKIPGGSATVLELPLDAGKDLKSLTVRALANEVVIGLMAATLERE